MKYNTCTSPALKVVEAVVHGRSEAILSAMTVIQNSQWVAVTPLPNDHYAISVKPENKGLLPHVHCAMEDYQCEGETTDD